MTGTAILTLGLLGTVAGLAGLRLSMERHHREAFGRPPPAGRRPMLVAAGSAMLAAAAALCVATLGWGVGLVAWCGLLTAAGLVLVFVPPLLPGRRDATRNRAGGAPPA